MAHLALLCTAVFAAGSSAPVNSFALLDGVHPTVFGVSTTTPAPGQTVQFTLGLNAPASGSESYTVSATANEFSSLPTSVQPAAGATQIVFNGTLSNSANGTINVVVGNSIGVTLTTPANN